MIAFLILFLHVLVSPFRTRARLHAAGIAAMDFLVVPTVGFKLLFVLVIHRHQRRRLISLSVTANPTAEWIAHQITDVFTWNEASSRRRAMIYGSRRTAMEYRRARKEFR